MKRLLLILLVPLLIAVAVRADSPRHRYRIRVGNRVIGMEVLITGKAGSDGVEQLRSVLYRPYDRRPRLEERSASLDPESSLILSYQRIQRSAGVSRFLRIDRTADGWTALQERPPLLPISRSQLGAPSDAVVMEGPSLLSYELLSRRLADRSLPAEIPFFDGEQWGSLSAQEISVNEQERVITLNRPVRANLTIDQTDSRLISLHLVDEGLLWEWANALEPLPEAEVPPVPDGLVRETFQILARGGIRLQGHLVRPRDGGPWPGVVLVGGFQPEPMDRGGWMPDLAEALAAEDIVAAYFAPRGVEPSQGSFKNSSWRNGADDLESVVTWLAGHPAIDPDLIGVAGHDGGGYLAAEVAGRSKVVQACILLAAPSTRYFPELLLEREEEPTETVLQELRDFAELVETTPGDWVTLGGELFNLRPTRELLQMEPDALFAALTVPTLILHGYEDAVVPLSHGRAIRTKVADGGNQDVQYMPIRNLGHELGTATELSGAGPGRQRIRVSRRLTGILIPWLKRRLVPATPPIDPAP